MWQAERHGVVGDWQDGKWMDGGDLGVEHTLAYITHNHLWSGVKEHVKERIHIPTIQSTQPWTPQLSSALAICLSVCSLV